jgi:hypothetical protein
VFVGEKLGDRLCAGKGGLIYVYRIVNSASVRFSSHSFQPYKHFFFIVKAKIKHFSRSTISSTLHAYTQQENKNV